MAQRRHRTAPVAVYRFGMLETGELCSSRMRVARALARVCAADEITAYGSRLSFPTTLAPRHWLANFEEAQTGAARRNSQSSNWALAALSEDVRLVLHVAQSVLRLRWTICSRPQPSRPLRKAFSKRQMDRSRKITANHRWHREHRKEGTQIKLRPTSWMHGLVKTFGP